MNKTIAEKNKENAKNALAEAKKRKKHNWTVEQENWLLKRVDLDVLGKPQHVSLLTKTFNEFWKTKLTLSSITGKVNRLLK